MGFWQQLIHHAARRALQCMKEDENFLFLRNNILFKDLSGEGLLFIANCIMERWYSKGDLICKQGNPGVCLYMVKQGLVEISFAADRQSTVCGRVRKGDLFGEISVLTGSERTATAMAVENDTALLALSIFDFGEFQERFPKDALQVIRGIADNIIASLIATVESYRSATAKSGRKDAEQDRDLDRDAGKGVRASADFITKAIVNSLTDKRRFLLGNKQVQNLSADTLDLLEKGMARHSYEKGETVGGQEQQVFYMIEKGSVEIFFGSPERTAACGKAVKGDLFGEIGSICGSRYGSTARSLENTDVLAISKDVFEHIKSRYPRDAFILIQGVMKAVIDNLIQFTKDYQAVYAESKKQNGRQ